MSGGGGLLGGEQCRRLGAPQAKHAYRFIARQLGARLVLVGVCILIHGRLSGINVHSAWRDCRIHVQRDLGGSAARSTTLAPSMEPQGVISASYLRAPK